MDKGILIKKVIKTEDRLFISKIIDKAEKACKYRSYTYSDFLDPYQRNLVQKVFISDSDICYSFEGGYEGAERVITVFRPDFSIEDGEDDFELPIKTLVIRVSQRSDLSHRDYLGALMSLGIKRDKIGDILVNEDSCKIVVLSDISEYIAMNLQKIGKFKVETEIENIEDLEPNEPKIKEISTTVASLRVDSIASAGFGISRSKISELIKAEKLSMNWSMTDSLTKQVKEGDMISIKGKGRIVLDNIGRVTKKGRIGIILKKYI